MIYLDPLHLNVIRFNNTFNNTFTLFIYIQDNI